MWQVNWPLMWPVHLPRHSSHAIAVAIRWRGAVPTTCPTRDVDVDVELDDSRRAVIELARVRGEHLDAIGVVCVQADADRGAPRAHRGILCRGDQLGGVREEGALRGVTVSLGGELRAALLGGRDRFGFGLGGFTASDREQEHTTRGQQEESTDQLGRSISSREEVNQRRDWIVKHSPGRR